MVTWFEAVGFANLLSARHDPPLAPCYEVAACTGELGKGMACEYAGATAATIYSCEGYRLPTDAEWEYAARAGTTTAFYSGEITPFGDFLENFSTCNDDPNLDTIGWYCSNSGGVAHPAKGLRANAFGLYDMAGNVAEWISDRSDGSNATSPTDPDGRVDNHAGRNVRGGAFALWAAACRMANQSSGDRNIGDTTKGFRLVRTLP